MTTRQSLSRTNCQRPRPTRRQAVLHQVLQLPSPTAMQPRPMTSPRLTSCRATGSDVLHSGLTLAATNGRTSCAAADATAEKNAAALVATALTSGIRISRPPPKADRCDPPSISPEGGHDERHPHNPGQLGAGL